MERSAPPGSLRWFAMMAMAAVLAMGVALLPGCAVRKDAVKTGESAPASSPTVRGPSGESGDPARRGRVVVRVTFREVPIDGARVDWLRSPDDKGKPPAESAVTDREGKASFSLPTGRYFLLAHWRRDGDYSRPVATGDRFAYFGSNPVYVAAGHPREMFIGLEEFREAPPTSGGDPVITGVSGVVQADGAPVPGVHVFAYLRAEEGLRDMWFAASAPTGEDGVFTLDLPPWNYYLVARKRTGGGVAGPLRKGDYFGYHAANPVTVVSGRATRVVIPVTLLKLRNVPSYSGETAAAAFIEGRIIDRTGKPKKGVYAALYDNPDLLNRPVYLSDLTGEDGRYRLPVPVAGRYYLGARSGYGGSPAPGGFYGRYEGTPDHSLIINENDRLIAIDLVVFDVQ